MLSAFLYDGLRSPFGKKGGALAQVRPDDLLAAVFRRLLARHDFDPVHIDDVMVGCANQAGEDSRCIARHAALVAGLPVRTPGTVIQRNCGSGLGAVISAAHAITSGEAEMVLGGGVESMSRAPFVVAKAEQSFSGRFTVFDSAVGARFPNPLIEARYGDDSMPQTADNLAQQFSLSREQVDAFAARSQSRYGEAAEEGFFAEEITPIEVMSAKRAVLVTKDECPRATTTQSLSGLSPLNHDGVTTAGNASRISDGAVGLLLGSERAASILHAEPMARLLASGVVGVEPRVMGIGPVPASELALKRAGLSLKDMDVIEINEAFSSQTLACLGAMGLSATDERVNPGGGAIAVGHPLGASGPRLLLTAVRRLRKVGGRYALVTLCVGVGQGIALVVEAL